MPKNPAPKPIPKKSDRTFISIVAVVLLIGVLSTPTFVIGKRALTSGGPTYAVLKAYVDSAIADARKSDR